MYFYFCVNNLIACICKAMFSSSEWILSLKQKRQERMCRCGGLTPAHSQQLLAHSPHTPSRTRQRIGRAKVKKRVGHDKDSEISEGKRKKKTKAMQWQSLTATSHKETDALPPSEQWPCPQYLPPCFNAEHDVVSQGISLWSPGASCPRCVPSWLLVPPQPTWGYKKREPCHCASTAQQQQKHWFSHKAKTQQELHWIASAPPQPDSVQQAR